MGLTGLSISAVGAGQGPGARQALGSRGGGEELPRVADHASITMSQVGHSAKMSHKHTVLPC